MTVPEELSRSSRMWFRRGLALALVVIAESLTVITIATDHPSQLKSTEITLILCILVTISAAIDCFYCSWSRRQIARELSL